MPARSPTIAERSVPPGLACTVAAATDVEAAAATVGRAPLGAPLAGVATAGACGVVAAQADSKRPAPPIASRRSTVRRRSQRTPPVANDSGSCISQVLPTLYASGATSYT